MFNKSHENFSNATKCTARPVRACAQVFTSSKHRWLHLTIWLHLKKNIKSMSNNIHSTFWIKSYTRTLPWYSRSLRISNFSCYPLNNSGFDSGFCAWNVATTQGRFAKRSPGALFCINSSPTCPKRLPEDWHHLRRFNLVSTAMSWQYLFTKSCLLINALSSPSANAT